MELKTSGKAITSLVCGILSIVMPFIGFILGVLAIVFGILSRNEIKRGEGKIEGGGMATAGLVCGIIGIAVVIFWVSIVGVIAGIISKFISEMVRYWGGWSFY